MAFISRVAAVVVLATLVAAASASHLSNLTDVDYLNFALNLEYLEANFYSYAAYGTPIPAADRGGSPAPTGKLAGFFGKLSPKARSVAARIAADELAHVRFLRSALGSAAAAQPPLNLRSAFWVAGDAAVGRKIRPAFEPYNSDVTFYIGAFIFEDVGVTAYKGAAPKIVNKDYLEAAAGILAVEAYHSGFIRSLLYQISNQYVLPYYLPIRTIVGAISNLRDAVDGATDLDKGISDPSTLNLILAPGDEFSVAFSRNITQVLAIVYLGTATQFGGFFPSGLNGQVY